MHQFIIAHCERFQSSHGEDAARMGAAVLSIRSSTSLLRRKSVTRCRAILCGGREAGDTAHRQL
jgi:hypothetical protein